MQITVYADVLFLTNFLANLFLLTLTAKIVHSKESLWRRFSASGLGSIYALLAFFPEFTFMQSILFRLLTALTLVCIAFRFHTWKHFLRCSLVFLSATLLSGGCCYALFFMTHFGIQTGAVLKNGILYWHMPVPMIVLAFSAVYGLMHVFEKLLTYYAIRKQNLHRLCICHDGNTVTLNALLDTGNMLYDTVYNLPVIIVERKAMMAMPNFEKTMTHQIPYRTLSGDIHEMPAFRPDNVQIDNEVIPACILALTDTQLCFDGQYNALLHPALSKGGHYENHTKVPANR